MALLVTDEASGEPEPTIDIRVGTHVYGMIWGTAVVADRLGGASALGPAG